MNDEFNKLIQVSLQNQEQAIELMEKLFDAAKPGAVYGEPVTVEGRTIITASEVTIGLGFGLGTGGGWNPKTTSENAPAVEEAPVGERNQSENEGTSMGGGGGGGGGGAGSRPVAVITIDKEGVTVKPVFDATKIALAFFTMLGSIFLMGSKIRKAANR